MLRQLGHLFTYKDPPLSAPSSWKVWLYRVVFRYGKTEPMLFLNLKFVKKKIRKKLGSCFLFLDKVLPSRFRDEILDFLGKIGIKDFRKCSSETKKAEPNDPTLISIALQR